MSFSLSRLRWYRNRLLAMTPREALHRVGELRRKRDWMRVPAAWEQIPPQSEAAFPDLPGLRAGLRRAAASRSPALAESLGRVREGRFSFLGRDWPVFDAQAGEPFWFHDPAHGGRWAGPELSSFRIDVRSTHGPGDDVPKGALGDVKYVWEPNRLQVLHPLAVAWADGEAWAGAAALARLRSWAAANPPYGGVNWVSGIESAMRMVGFALLCAAAGPDGIPPADRGFLRGVMVAHARQMSAFPSLHSSANNHRIAEGLGLLIAGILLPEHGEAWQRDGRSILEQEAVRQILPDGVGAEQSPTYQAFTMEMLGFGMLLSADAGRPLDPGLTDRLASGAAFLLTLMNESGHVPAIGDDDEGRVLAQPPDREPRYVASIVAAVAGLARRPDLLPPGRDPHLRDALFGAPEQARTPALGVWTFREGGYTVARQRIEGRTVRLVFDHGPLGYLGLAAHGHSDALALWLDIGDQPILIDAGTYLYHSGRSSRSRLRESPAHSTLTVGGASQSVALPGFTWANRAHATILDEQSGQGWSVTGQHAGYRKRFGCLHQRRLQRTPDGFLLADRLAGASRPLAVEIRFLLSAVLCLEQRGDAVMVLAGEVPQCRFIGPKGFGIVVSQDGVSGPMHSARFGHLARAQGIVFTGPLGEDEVVTRISILPAE